jgi:hypothetical protein
VKVDLSVTSHNSTEKSGKTPKFKVTLRGQTLDNLDVTLSIVGINEKLLQSYPVDEFFSVNMTKPQQKLSGGE